MFDITKEDIHKLSDKDLRDLVGKLCEAELRKLKIPAIYVTYGGDQDAADGGIDVCVRIDDRFHINGFIPSNFTGFQIKVPKMSLSQINKEMRPNGNLRSSIKEIANHSGSYIIVSGKDDTSFSMLTSRLEAMRKAVIDYPASNNLKLDFYDVQRVCTWVNEHASIIQWVHMKTGTSYFGWQPYMNWSDPKRNIDDEFFVHGVKLVKVGNDQYNELPMVEGVNEIRRSLNTPKISVRIVGLSGVGKTRLAQALCDNRIGQNAINPDYVVYTDISNSPNPSPQTMVELLTAQNKRTILIIDNCQSDLHHVLSQILIRYYEKGNVNVNLLTIEYDIQPDQKEDVIVYKLEPSIELIEQLLKQRHDFLGQNSIQRIAAFSGGNARIALTLAGLLKSGDNISMFSDDQLFSRLFWQGKNFDGELLDVAKVCSIVYSFSIEEKDMELNALAQIADLPVLKFYKYIQELLRRGLMQCRNKWRSVLPHVLANWLADRALKDIPITYIKRVLEGSKDLRLLRSFSKRLGYQPNNEIINKIVDDWFSSDGLLSDISKLDNTGIKILYNIAPISMEKTLNAIEQIELSKNAEKFFSSENPHFSTFMDIIMGIAYDSIYFERCVNLLIRSHADCIKGLFQLNLSGTLAPANLRLSVIDKLIKKGGDQTDLGFVLLDSALKTSNFHANFPRDFGSRNRDTGYSPNNESESRAWYAYFIGYMQDLLIQKINIEKVKQLLLKNLQGLLVDAGMVNEIHNFTKIGLINDDWVDCWIALKNIIYNEHIKPSKEMLFKLKKLEKILAPKSALENARISILSDDSNIFYYHKETKESLRIKQIAYVLANHEDDLNQLLPDIFCSNSRSIWPFAVSLAKKCMNPKSIWSAFIELYTHNDKSECNPRQLLGGFLWGLNCEKPELVEEFLDEAVENELAYIFPLLQASVTITKQGVKRIIRSIQNGNSRSLFYSPIRGAKPGHIDRKELSEIVRMIDDKDICTIIRLLLVIDMEGIKTGIEIYAIFMHGKTTKDVSDEFVILGFELLSKYKYPEFAGDLKQRKRDGVAGDTIDITDFCFSSDNFTSAKENFCQELKNNISCGIMYPCYYSTNKLAAIAKTQPILFLDTFLDYSDKTPYRTKAVLMYNYERTILYEIKDDVLHKWCEKKPQTRYLLLSSVFYPIREENREEGIAYVWAPIAITILNNLSDPCTAIDSMIENCFYNTSFLTYRLYPVLINWLEYLKGIVDKKFHYFIKEKISELVKREKDDYEVALWSRLPRETYYFESDDE